MGSLIQENFKLNHFAVISSYTAYIYIENYHAVASTLTCLLKNYMRHGHILILLGLVHFCCGLDQMTKKKT